MKTHVQRSVAGCFAILRQLRSIRRVVPSSVYQSLVVALCYHGWIMVTRHWLASRLACLFFNRLQSVLNAAARSVDRWSSSLGAYYRRSRQFFTGFEHLSALSLNWRSSSTELFMALHLSTCRISCSTSPICRRDTEVACARPLPVFLKSARHDVSLSAIAAILKNR